MHEALVGLGTFGPGMVYSLVTYLQMRACGGIKAWKKGGFGATLPEELEENRKEVRRIEDEEFE